MGALWSGARLQWDWIRTSSDYWMVTLTNPLTAVVFLAIMREAGRDDLLAHAVLAPAFLGMWAMALFVAGEIVEGERWLQTLALSISSPASFGQAVLGRIATIVTLSLIGFPSSWLVAWALFGVPIPVHHPGAFVLGLAATVIAVSGHALIMAALFALARSARIFQNTMSYPFYVLGGILVPVSFLPQWIQPVSNAIFLKWSADLLRDSLSAAPVASVASRVAVILGLGVAAFGVGVVLLRRIVDRLRVLGTVTYA